MLITNLRMIGNNLLKFRKIMGLTQSEVAEKAEISDRTYADIERGSVNLRLETLLKICSALEITPNDILVSSNESDIDESEIMENLQHVAPSNKSTALQILNIYLNSLKK